MGRSKDDRDEIAKIENTLVGFDGGRHEWRGYHTDVWMATAVHGLMIPLARIQNNLSPTMDVEGLGTMPVPAASVIAEVLYDGGFRFGMKPSEAQRILSERYEEA